MLLRRATPCGCSWPSLGQWLFRGPYLVGWHITDDITNFQINRETRILPIFLGVGFMIGRRAFIMLTWDLFLSLIAPIPHFMRKISSKTQAYLRLCNIIC